MHSPKVDDRHIHLPPCHQDTDLHCMHTFATVIDYPTAQGIHAHATESTKRQARSSPLSSQQFPFVSQTKVQQVARSAQTPGLTCLLGFPPQLSLSLQPVLPSSPGSGRLQSLSQGDAPPNLHGFILYLSSPQGCLGEEGAILSRSLFTLGLTTVTRIPP